MIQHLLNIEANDRPVLLERVLRVIRHRGFTILKVTATQNQSNKIAKIEIIVESERPISLITNQVEKLWDIRTVDVTTLESA
ncbi:acetolactate synthase 2 small subunit [Aliivibrio kagoshimensis]|jgi:acetolactate synthase II small subunit|uniref:acetolactate synthase 2 small subunit n=1 Tax=Aliivibrio kagoshimensis TaxID=2910230 RepID=UPI003D146D3B